MRKKDRKEKPNPGAGSVNQRTTWSWGSACVKDLMVSRQINFSVTGWGGTGIKAWSAGQMLRKRNGKNGGIWRWTISVPGAGSRPHSEVWFWSRDQRPEWSGHQRLSSDFDVLYKRLCEYRLQETCPWKLDTNIEFEFKSQAEFSLTCCRSVILRCDSNQGSGSETWSIGFKYEDTSLTLRGLIVAYSCLFFILGLSLMYGFKVEAESSENTKRSNTYIDIYLSVQGWTLWYFHLRKYQRVCVCFYLFTAKNEWSHSLALCFRYLCAGSDEKAIKADSRWDVMQTVISPQATQGFFQA